MRIQSLLAMILFLGACAGSQPNARQVPVTAKFAIQVDKETIMAPGFDGELASELRQDVVCVNFSTFANFENDVRDKAPVFVPRVGPMPVTMPGDPATPLRTSPTLTESAVSESLRAHSLSGGASPFHCDAAHAASPDRRSRSPSR